MSRRSVIERGYAIRMACYILQVVGIVFLIAGLFFAIYDQEKRTEYLPTEAVIVSQEHGKTQVTYEAGTETYNADLNYSNSVQHPGDTVEVYINPENPGEWFMPSVVFAVVFCVLGGIVAVTGLVGMAFLNRIKKKQQELLENGTMVWATVIERKLTWSMRVGHLYGRVFIAQDTAGRTYQSEPVVFLYEEGEWLGKNIKVYVNDDGDYYVDLFG